MNRELAQTKNQNEKRRRGECRLVIEINKDIDRYQESVALGLNAKQLIFSAASLISGAGVVLLLYRYIGLTGSAYVAVPVVAPIALGGFYSYNGMSFYDVMNRKFHMMFGNKALVYVSTENEAVIKSHQMKDQSKAIPLLSAKDKKREVKENREKQGNIEDFEVMKKKMLKVAISCFAIVVIAIVATILLKFLV